MEFKDVVVQSLPDGTAGRPHVALINIDAPALVGFGPTPRMLQARSPLVRRSSVRIFEYPP